MPQSLVGRILHASHDGRDLSNMFRLVVEETPTSITMVPVLTEITWTDDCSGYERPNLADDGQPALPAMQIRELATREVDASGMPFFREGILTYRLWDGRDMPCRYL